MKNDEKLYRCRRIQYPRLLLFWQLYFPCKNKRNITENYNVIQTPEARENSGHFASFRVITQHVYNP